MARTRPHKPLNHRSCLWLYPLFRQEAAATATAAVAAAARGWHGGEGDMHTCMLCLARGLGLEEVVMDKREDLGGETEEEEEVVEEVVVVVEEEVVDTV